MTKKMLVIPGHGAGDSGAVGGGETEADLVRKLAARMKAYGGDEVKRTSYRRNYYADNGVARLDSSVYDPNAWLIVELHMDSAGSGARGGHVIQRVKTKRGAAAAKAIAELLPGRAERHVKRTGLRNPNAAAARGYEYMLVECGFITNAGDREFVIEHMDEIAKVILKACGVKPRSTPLKKVKCPW